MSELALAPDHADPARDQIRPGTPEAEVGNATRKLQEAAKMSNSASVIDSAATGTTGQQQSEGLELHAQSSELAGDMALAEGDVVSSDLRQAQAQVKAAPTTADGDGLNHLREDMGGEEQEEQVVEDVDEEEEAAEEEEEEEMDSKQMLQVLDEVSAVSSFPHGLLFSCAEVLCMALLCLATSRLRARRPQVVGAQVSGRSQAKTRLLTLHAVFPL